MDDATFKRIQLENSKKITDAFNKVIFEEKSDEAMQSALVEAIVTLMGYCDQQLLDFDAAVRDARDMTDDD